MSRAKKKTAAKKMTIEFRWTAVNMDSLSAIDVWLAEQTEAFLKEIGRTEAKRAILRGLALQNYSDWQKSMPKTQTWVYDPPKKTP